MLRNMNILSVLLILVYAIVPGTHAECCQQFFVVFHECSDTPNETPTAFDPNVEFLVKKSTIQPLALCVTRMCPDGSIMESNDFFAAMDRVIFLVVIEKAVVEKEAVTT